MKEHLYNPDGTGTLGCREIDREIEAFVDNIAEKFSGYNDAELELYIVESVTTRFCYHRIQQRMKKMREEKENENMGRIVS